MDAFCREACLQAALNHYAARRDGKKPSLRDAAAEYSVSPSTLRHRLQNGNRTASEAARERQKLTETQEKAIVEMLHRRAAVGYPMTPMEVTSLADKFFESRGSTVHLGMRWFPSFKLRHPDIHTVRSNRIDHSRMYAVDSATVDAYFKILGTYLREEAILPEDIWNADESGLMMGRSQSSQVVVPLLQKGKKRAVAADNGDCETVSCMACVSAAGAHLQPVLVFSRTQAKREACGKAVEAGLAPPDKAKYLGTPGNAVRVFHSKNGFLTSQLIVQWLQEVFLPATARDPPRTRVLVIDGACAHATHEVMYECAKNGVKLVYLPAHSSHITQPLDLAVFSPLKNHYGQAVKVLSHRLAGKPWGRKEFISIFRGAWQKALNRQNITSGFRTAGIWPYDPQAVRQSLLSYNNSVEPASEAAKKAERPALATLTTNTANTLPKTVKATRATLQAAGKERYAVLELALEENARKDRLIDELRTTAEQLQFMIADRDETIAALQAKASRPRAAFKAQQLARGVDWLKGLLGEDYTDMRWHWIAAKAKAAKIEPRAWIEAQDQATLLSELALVIPSNSKQSTEKVPSKRRQKKRV